MQPADLYRRVNEYKTELINKVIKPAYNIRTSIIHLD